MNTSAPFSKKTSGKTATDHWVVGPSSSTAKQKSNGRIFTLILFSFIVLFLLIMLLFGTRIYSTVNDSRVSSDTTRLGLSLIANSVRMNDTADAIGRGEGPEGPALVLTESLGSGTYETRIYAYQGKVVEEYATATSAYTPEKAREITRSELFDFEYADGLITIHTDTGSINIAFRSAKGGS